MFAKRSFADRPAPSRHALVRSARNGVVSGRSTDNANSLNALVSAHNKTEVLLCSGIHVPDNTRPCLPIRKLQSHLAISFTNNRDRSAEITVRLLKDTNFPT